MYGFLEDSEESWRAIIKENKDKYKYSLFPEISGAYFFKTKKQVFIIRMLYQFFNHFTDLPDNNVKE